MYICRLLSCPTRYRVLWASGWSIREEQQVLLCFRDMLDSRLTSQPLPNRLEIIPRRIFLQSLSLFSQVNFLMLWWRWIGILTKMLLAGNIRRFRRVCEHIQAQVCTRRPPPSPRAQRKFTTELSESSSCGSDSSELFLNTRQVMNEMIWWNKNESVLFSAKCSPVGKQRSRKRM